MSSGKRPVLTTSETVKERLMKLIFQPKKKSQLPSRKQKTIFICFHFKINVSPKMKTD